MKKKNNILKVSFLLVTLIFTFIYIMVNMGYYEYASYKKKVFTEEQIKQFEEDVKNGKEINLKDYKYDEKSLITTKKRFPLKISEYISKSTKKGVNTIFKYLNKIMN